MDIGIFVYDQAEVLDFCGPFEVFSTANRLSEKPTSFDVRLISEQKEVVVARGGFRVIPDYSLDNHPELDVLLVVGGVHHEQLENPKVLDWVAQTSEHTKIVASVCTGAFILAEAVLLAGKKVTTHWEDIDDLRERYQDLIVIENQRWVESGKYVTSGGISAGIDMSLHLVSRLAGLELAQKTAKQMEFDWRRD